MIYAAFAQKVLQVVVQYALTTASVVALLIGEYESSQACGIAAIALYLMSKHTG